MSTKENIEQGSKFFEVATLRDYFAAKAMQALIHSHSDAYFNKNDSFNQEENVRLSYEIADKMMETHND